MKTGVAGFAFGIMPDGSPGESNKKIAFILDWITMFCPDWLIYTDQEVAQAMKSKPHFVTSGHPFDENYRDTESSVSEIADKMKGDGVEQMFIVAHWFLHRFKAIRVFKKYGIAARKIPAAQFGWWWIPFCKGSAQWWTRGPARLLICAVIQALTGRKGK